MTQPPLPRYPLSPDCSPVYLPTGWTDRRPSSQQGWGLGAAGPRHKALTTAGEAVPVQLIALVATTHKGPIGVDTALLTWGSHVTLVHIWGCHRRGVRDKERLEPPTPGLARSNPTIGPPPGTPRHQARPSLTHTGAVVGPQLEAWLTLAAEGAGQVHAAVLAVAVATLVYV